MEVLAIQEQLRTMLRQNGICDVDFTTLEERDLQWMEEQGLGVGKCRYGMSLVARLSDGIVNEIDGAPTHTYFHHYRTVNTFLDQMALRAGILLAQNGYEYITVAASQSINNNGWNYNGRFSHKHLACHCGLGTIGKSALFLHNVYGPRVRLASVFTDCPFPQAPKEPKSVCGNCTLCYNACPAHAISGKEWRIDMERTELFNPEKCSQHMKTAYQKIGRGAVCGICMQVCPRGQARDTGKLLANFDV